MLAYEGPLPARDSRVKVDITRRERLTSPLEMRPVLRGYDEYVDLAQTSRLQTYSLVEIAAEKIVALLDRARVEPRDLYDLWFLLGEGASMREICSHRSLRSSSSAAATWMSVRSCCRTRRGDSPGSGPTGSRRRWSGCRSSKASSEQCAANFVRRIWRSRHRALAGAEAVLAQATEDEPGTAGRPGLPSPDSCPGSSA